MTVTEKYQSVIDLSNALGTQAGRAEEDNGVLRLWGTVKDNYQKDQVWDSIKSIGGDAPSDIVADIQVENPDIYTTYTVASGDSLSKIAKHFYGDMMEFKKIFEANRDILDSPDRIDVGQVLTIPNP